MTHGKWQLVPDRRTGTVTPCINHVITVQVSHQDDTVEIRGDTAPKVVKRSRIGTRVRVRMMQTSAVSILHTPSWGGGLLALERYRGSGSEAPEAESFLFHKYLIFVLIWT